MRKLTIKREQSAVGSLIKMKVCIEDKNSSELIINGTPCRAIGTLQPVARKFAKQKSRYTGNRNKRGEKISPRSYSVWSLCNSF